MDDLLNFLLFSTDGVISGLVVGFFLFAIGVPIFLGILRALGMYAVVQEGSNHVYTLFGKVRLVLTEPGLNFPWIKIGPTALLLPLFGQRRVIDVRLDQQYLRSQPVNSEEGAPMGIGVWYEMRVSDPVSYLFKNADPKGSLAANVSNAAIRCLSNLPLNEMLGDRHKMSQSVRDEVSPRSLEWGYKLGSVYIRKVHFRDAQMIRQIESKVVNRLRQVTAAIKQDGTNQVNIISSTADRQAATAFAQAKALRPTIVGAALQEISKDPEILRVLFDVLEIERLIENKGEVTLIPANSGDLLPQLLVSSAVKPS